MTKLELQLMAALIRMDTMHEMMMKEANHGASAYSAKTLQEMNEAPIQAAKAIQAAGTILQDLGLRA